jgi:hypothetical protein
MLLQIRDFIRRAGVVSTQQLMREFRIEATALQPMLNIWVRKGLIAPCQLSACRSKCGGCAGTTTYYEYIFSECSNV